MAGEQDVVLAPEAPKRSKLKLILVLVFGSLLVGGGTVGGLYFMGLLPGASDAVAAGEPAEPVEEPPKEAIYVSLDPAFTVNFKGKGGARFLQISLQAMTRDQEVSELIGKHMPMIRNDLMLLFSSKSSQELSSREGKEMLQAETLAGMQKVLARETGKDGIEAVYFTSFVMQ